MQSVRSWEVQTPPPKKKKKKKFYTSCISIYLKRKNAPSPTSPQTLIKYDQGYDQIEIINHASYVDNQFYEKNKATRLDALHTKKSL